MTVSPLFILTRYPPSYGSTVSRHCPLFMETPSEMSFPRREYSVISLLSVSAVPPPPPALPQEERRRGTINTADSLFLKSYLRISSPGGFQRGVFVNRFFKSCLCTGKKPVVDPGGASSPCCGGRCGNKKLTPFKDLVKVDYLALYDYIEHFLRLFIVGIAVGEELFVECRGDIVL